MSTQEKWIAKIHTFGHECMISDSFAMELHTYSLKMVNFTKNTLQVVKGQHLTYTKPVEKMYFFSTP